LGFIHHRAVFDTGAAACTKIHVDAARTLVDFDLEIPLFTRNALDIRKGNEFNVDVPADLDQFGRDNSHGTVIGGKGLIQLRHNPADGTGFFNEIDIITGIGHIQRRLHSRDPTTDHHYRSGLFF
jgi:hypothetical protein